jgi:hypothetical protein
MRHAAKLYQSEAAILKALKSAGCDVERGQDCDLYVRPKMVPGGTMFAHIRPLLMEVKTPGPNSKRRTPIQKRLQTIFGWQYVVVSSPEEALKAVGIK